MDRGTTWWAPRAVGWWTGVLFAIGASFFAVGSAPGYVNAAGKGTTALTLFAGSIFFTAAAYLQFFQAINPPGDSRPRKPSARVRLAGFRPRSIAWWAALVQLAGTLYFNVSTFQATRVNLSTPLTDHLVWKPDIFGSVCFLVASSLAWADYSHRDRPFRHKGASWWIVALNFAGSVFFGVSAVAAYVVTTTGQDVNAALANLGTFTGALCFFAGAVLLLPESARDAE